MADEITDEFLRAYIQEHYDGCTEFTPQETFDIMCCVQKFPSAFDLVKFWKDQGLEEGACIVGALLENFYNELGDGSIRLDKALEVFDENGDGEFDRVEMKKMLKTLDRVTYDLYGDEDWDTLVDKAFELADKDGNEKISKTELKELLLMKQLKVDDAHEEETDPETFAQKIQD